MRRPINPYIAGKPLWDRQTFFGRDDILEWVERELQNPGNNALVLFGQRRIGKTSILLQLQQSLPDELFLPIYFDLQDQATRPLGEVLADLADTITEETGLEPPNPTEFDNQGRYFRRFFLPKLEKELGTERRLVFLLDEFDVLDQVAENELPATTAAKAFFPFLRRLMTKHAWLAFVFIVGRRAEDLSLNFTATFKTSLVRELWVLDQTSAEQLIDQAVSNKTLRFTDSAVARILSLTNRHPYLTQLLCQRIWEQAYRTKPATAPLIEIEQVENAVPDMLKSGQQALIWLWNGLTPAEKIYAAALAEIATAEVTIPKEQVIQVLATHAARLRTREVELASRDLVKRRVLELAGEQAYRFNIELFRRWVHTNKPLRDVKDEIDQIDPVAEQLFNVGREEFRRRQWEKATGYFKDALGRNNKHFRARLYLGESLLELEELDEAVVELEQAYQLDQDEAKFALVRGLLSLAKIKGNAGDEDGLLVVCERILEISPHEREALALQTAIWTLRGDAALAKGDLDAALSAYRKAGDRNKMGEVQIFRQRQALAILETQVQAYIKAERWKDAAEIYEQLIAQAPDQDSRSTWERELKRCKEEHELKLSFELGLKAMQEAEWKQAQQAFLQVVNRRIAYQKDGRSATELLDQARKRQAGQVEAIPVRTQTSHAKEDSTELLDQAEKRQPHQIKASPVRTQTLPVKQDSTKLWHQARKRQASQVKNNYINKYQNAFQILYLFILKLIKNFFKYILKSLIMILDTISISLILLISSYITYYIIESYLPENIMDQNPELAVLLAVEAVGQGPLNGRLIADAMTTLHNVIPDSNWITILQHTGPVRFVAWSKDNSRILTASSDKTAKVWDAASGDLLFILSGHESWVYHAAWSGDESRILTASDDKTVKLWDATSGGLLLTLSGHTSSVYDAVWSQDNNRIVTASSDNTAKVWDTTNGDLLLTLSGHTSDVMHAAFSHDDRRILTASRDNTAKVWDATNGDLLFTLSRHTSEVIHAVWDSNDHRILTSSRDNTAKVWDGESGQELFTLNDHRLDVIRAIFSHDNRQILTASSDNIVNIWDAKNGRLLFTLSDHSKSLIHVAWSHNDSRILTTNWDNTAKVWDVASGQLLFTLNGHTSRINHAAWSGDDSRIVTASSDGTARIYLVGIDELIELACERVSRNMTTEEWQRYVGSDVPYQRTCPNLPRP